MDNALLRVKNSHIWLEFKINDATLFIPVHLSPLLNFSTVFSVHPELRLPIFRQLQVNEAAL